MTADSARIQPWSWWRVSPRARHLFLLILGLALGLRFGGILWGWPGLPYTQSYHPDEPKIIQGAYQFPDHILTNLDLRYPTAFHYLLGVLALPLRGLPYPADYDLTYLLGRLITVLAGTGSVLLTYLLAVEIDHDRDCAILAAFLLAFSMFHVTNSAWATTDVLSSFGLTLYLLFLLKMLRSGSVTQAALAGLALGFLVGTKYTGAIALVPTALLLVQRQVRRVPHRSIRTVIAGLLKDRQLWALFGLAGMTFLLTTPGIAVHPRAFLASIRFESGRLAKDALPLYHPRTYLILLESLSVAVGWPLALASLGGMAFALARKNAILNSLVVMLVGFCLYFGSSVLPRYWILVLPVLAILSSAALLHLSRSSLAWMRTLGLSLIALVGLSALVYSFLAVISRYPDTRTQAARYLAQVAPPGATIGLGYDSPENASQWQYPFIDYSVYRKRSFLRHPDFIILSSYDFEPVRQILQQGLLDESGALPETVARQWYASAPPPPEVFALHRDLWLGTSAEYCLIQKFTPRSIHLPVEFPPPVIEIYLRYIEPHERTLKCLDR